MKQILSALVVIFLIVSCSKKDAIVTPPPAVILPDTLSAGWSKITVTTAPVSDIFFTDNTTGYAAAGDGLYKSINSGLNWAKVYTPGTSNSYFNAAAFGNSACFANNTAFPLRTQDGGVSFQNTVVGTDNISDCFYTSANNCFLSGPTKISRSTDGGLTFPFSYSFTDFSDYSSLFFLSPLLGWDIRYSGIYKTTDGGTTWNLLHTITGSPASVEFTDNFNGYYSSASGGYITVYKTTDAGNTWLQMFQNNIYSGFPDIDFVSTAEGYACAGKRLYKTTDGGVTWNSVIGLGNTSIVEIDFTDAAHGWACCNDGTILKFQ